MRGTAIRDITRNQLESMPRDELDDFIAEIHDLRERYVAAVHEAGLAKDIADRAERYAAERRAALLNTERRAELAERERDVLLRQLANMGTEPDIEEP